MQEPIVELAGVSLLGFQNGGRRAGFAAVNPATGTALAPEYSSADQAEVELAAQRAHTAFAVYGRLSGARKGVFLHEIAAAIESRGPQILERAHVETALPLARLQSELGRTAGQLRLFAGVVEEGSWVNARLDSPDPARKPPKPDIRSMWRPLGPTVVFGASNFPLAFSVAGGDTASALAAGNPVIVKAHPAHPGTSELVGVAIRESVRRCGLPEGVFSLLFDAGIEVGTRLVQHPLIQGVGFTGSFAAGKALMQLAAARPVPIPCYAEMGSVNPVFVLPGALKQRYSEIAAGLHSSFTLGAGQFCTKPGAVFLPKLEEKDVLIQELTSRAQANAPQVMLTRAIADRYRAGIERRAQQSGVRQIAKSDADREKGSTTPVAVFATDTRSFLEGKELGQEIFGPSVLLVEYGSPAELLTVAAQLEGHLTATVHGTDEDLAAGADLLAILETKVGRLILNGYPTGVELGHAMVHGGPYPATSDGRSTSVGSQAIFRFARPVCYQNWSESLLPDELKMDNPLKILRLVDGVAAR
jgi:alpha-ketoglutaric semialdehyde dehydrogenase